MCLCKVDYPTKHTRRKYGYKVLVSRLDGELSTYYFGQANMVEGGTYLSTCGESSRGYPLGFHIALDIRGGRYWRAVHADSTGIIHRVRFSKVVASGLDDCRLIPTIVARRMTILEEV